MGIEVAGAEVSEFANEGILPVAMNAEGHGIVHDIVLVGDGVEDLVDEGLFVVSGDVAEAEVVVGVVIFLIRAKEAQHPYGSIHIN